MSIAIFGRRRRRESGVIFADPFDRANSTTTLGSPWTALGTSVWGISSNEAYHPSGGTENNRYAVVESNASNVRVRVTFSALGGTNLYLAFRCSDINNLFILAVTPTGAQIWRRQAGAYTSIASDLVACTDGDVGEVVASGSSLIATIDGVERLTATDTFNQTATMHGIGQLGASTTSRFNDFSVRTA